MATHVKFTSIEHFHSETSELKCFGGEECEYGYTVPGHGLKGKQKVLITNEDIISRL